MGLVAGVGIGYLFFNVTNKIRTDHLLKNKIDIYVEKYKKNF